MRKIVWVLERIQRQICCDDQWLAASVSGIDHGEDLFQCIFCSSLCTKIIQNQKIIGIQIGKKVSTIRAEQSRHTIQNRREICHQNRHVLLQQRVCNAPGKKGFSGSHIAKQEQSNIFPGGLLPMFHIALGFGSQPWRFSVIVGKRAIVEAAIL